MKSALLTVLVFTPACTAPAAREVATPAPTPGAEPARPATVHHEAKGALGPYSALVDAGELVFVSGRIGDAQGDFENEVATAIFAVEVELARANLTLADVVQATCYLTDMELYARFNAVYAERVPKPWPARAVVGVSALPAGAHVEIAVVARRR